MRLLLAARLSAQGKNRQEGINLTTQDKRARAWATDPKNGHEIVAVSQDSGVSGKKVAPFDRKGLGPWLSDPELMQQYDGIVAYNVTRISRDYCDTPLMRRWADQNGKSLFIIDANLRWTPDDHSQAQVWAHKAESANEEWDANRDATMRALGEIKLNGYLVGKPPWGYASEGDKYARVLVPTDAGRYYVPLIFKRCIAGESLADIGAWLAGECVAPTGVAGRPATATWSPKSLGQIIRNATYAGRRTDASGYVTKCEALVTMAVFIEAGKALDGRRGKRGDARKPARPVALLTGWLVCAGCFGAMYRTTDGVYYRCAASPQFGSARRSECAHMIPLAVADQMARDILSASTAPVTRMEWQDGDRTAIELAELAADIADVQRQYAAGELDLPAFVAKLGPLDAAKRELESREPVPGRMVPVETGETYGMLAARAGSDSELRELMKGKGKFLAWKAEKILTFADAGRFFPDAHGPAIFPGLGADAILPAAELARIA